MGEWKQEKGLPIVACVDGRKEKGKRRMEMACPSSNYTKVTMD